MSIGANVVSTALGSAEHVTIGARLVRIARLVVAWHERARSRRALLELNETLLSDIGISRLEALREAGKPFWKA